jgi:hypothetical protein
LGKLNIEQTKFLNWEDMAQLLVWGGALSASQREELERLATQASFQGLACFNARCLGDFYFDPRTKQHIGQETVLEGLVSLGMHSDFILTEGFGLIGSALES